MPNRELTYEDLLKIADVIRTASHFSEFRLKVGDIEVSVRRTNGNATSGANAGISVAAPGPRTEAPSGQVASAVTVFDAEQIERRQEPPLADLLRQAPGTTVVRVGAPGRPAG